MRQVISIASALGVALLIGSQAVAQQPPPNPPAGGTPEAMPFDIPYGSAITTDKAKQILSAAEAEAKKRNWKMNIAVVDPNGDLIHFLRMDGAQVASVAISQGKARTAARYRRPTQVFYNAFEKPDIPMLQHSIQRWWRLPGGFPLRRGRAASSVPLDAVAAQAIRTR